MIAIVEIPKGSNFKYEIDKASGQLTLDRVLELDYPESYGFFPETLSLDGDPLDLFILASRPIAPLARVKVEILGVVVMRDRGEMDEKIIAHIKGDSSFDPFWHHKIRTFLENYKTGTEILSIEGRERALEIIKEARERYEI